MRKQKIAVGPGASSLMLIAVVLALTVLTVLTMISARNDESLSLRSVETRQRPSFPAGAETPGEAYLQAVRSALPEGMRMEGDQILWEEKGNDRRLECGVKLKEAGTFPRTEWVLHRLGEADIWEDSFDDLSDLRDDIAEENPEDETGADDADMMDDSDLLGLDDENNTL